MVCLNQMFIRSDRYLHHCGMVAGIQRDLREPLLGQTSVRPRTTEIYDEDDDLELGLGASIVHL